MRLAELFPVLSVLFLTVPAAEAQQVYQGTIQGYDLIYPDSNGSPPASPSLSYPIMDTSDGTLTATLKVTPSGLPLATLDSSGQNWNLSGFSVTFELAGTVTADLTEPNYMMGYQMLGPSGLSVTQTGCSRTLTSQAATKGQVLTFDLKATCTVTQVGVSGVNPQGTPNQLFLLFQFLYGGFPGFSSSFVEVQVEYVMAPTASSNPDLAIDHVEFVQATQTSDGTVKLVAGKPTVLRIFPKVTGTSTPLGSVTADLTWSGQPGTTYHSKAPVTAVPAPDRTVLTSSSNVVLLAPMYAQGNQTFTIHVVYPSGQTDPNPSNPARTKTVTVPFLASTFPAKYHIRYVPFHVGPPSLSASLGIATLYDPTGNIANFASFTDKVLPIPAGTLDYAQVATVADPHIISTVPPDGTGQWYPLDVLARILKFLDDFQSPQIDHLVAWLPGAIYVNPAAGGNHLAYFHVTGTTSIHSDFSNGSFELIDGFPRFHDFNTDYSQWSLAEAVGKGLGLAGQSDTTVTGEVGLDIPNRQLIAPTTSDLMARGSIEEHWISPALWESLRSTGYTPPKSSGNTGNIKGRAAVSAAAAASNGYLLISGSAQSNGSTGTLDPAYPPSSVNNPDPSDPNGNYCLQFTGAAGALGSYCFTLTFVSPLDGVTPETEAFFDEVVPFPSGAITASLVTGGRTLATLKGGPPTISITFPQAGVTWQGTAQTISWTGANTGGATPVYMVEYSSDGGQTWLPLTMDTNATALQFDASQINGGSNVYFRVTGSTGLIAGSATVGPITVAQTPQIAVAPTSLNFGAQTTGGYVDGTVAIQNSGTGPLNVTSLTLSNTAFTVLDPPAPFAIQAGTQRNVTVRFFAAGSNGSGTLSIASNGSTARVTVPLNAQDSDSAVPNFQVTPAFPNAGTVTVGTTQGVTLTLSNAGAADLSVTAISSSDNRFVAMKPTLPLAIPAQTSQSVTVNYTPTAATSDKATITFATTDPNHASAAVSITGTGVAAAAPAGPTPVITSGGVVNGASFSAPLVRGSLATVFGSNLASSTASNPGVTPLPLTLGGAQVTVAGVAAPLVYASAAQINFQVPFEAPISGTVPVVVTVNGTPSTTQMAPMAEYAPGVFTYTAGTAIAPIIVHESDNTLVTASKPAVANELLVIYATGVGTFDHPPATGAASAGSPLATAINPTVSVGGAPANVSFTGLTPGDVGLVQINIQLPATLPPGASLPVLVKFGSASSQSVNLNVAGHVSTGAGNLSVTFSPNPVPKASNGAWTCSITLRETGGVGVTLTKMVIAGTDSTALIAPLFGSNHVAANGSLTATISLTGVAPPSEVWQFTGNDDAGHTGLSWSGTVSFQ